MKREADFTITFRHWIKANPAMPSGAFEIKQTRTNTLLFSAVKEHQLDALNAARSYMGLLYKAPDDSRGVKPFDMFYLRNASAWIVIKYPGQFSIISYDAFTAEQKLGGKSLSKDRAKEIAWKTISL